MMRFTRPPIKAGLKVASLGKIAIGLLIVITVFIAGRIYETQRPALHPWHTGLLMKCRQRRLTARLADILAREDAIFHEMKIQLTNTLPDDQNAA